MKHYDYDVVVIGAGAAGLTAARAASSAGAKTALVEAGRLGGTCTWTGCIPAKALLASAKLLSQARLLSEFGIGVVGAPAFNADMVMSHVRYIMARESSWAPPDFIEKEGVELLYGLSHFDDNGTLAVNGNRITAKRFIVCTGSHPRIPDIEGLEEIHYLTNENVFSITSLPGSMAILGGGIIGVEMAQAFSRLGVEVSLIEMKDRILAGEDEETARVLEEVLDRDRVKIYAGRKVVKFVKKDHAVEVSFENKLPQTETVTVQSVFIAAGREAKVRDLRLNEAGVRFTPAGVEVDDELKTTADNIYACGDVVGPYRFVHMAEYQARIAVANALGDAHKKTDYSAVPWCLFTSPELAHFGLTEHEARERNGNAGVYKVEYRQNARAIAELEDTGFAKVITDEDGRILGAHVVGAGAGEIIHEYILARSAGIPLGRISEALHIYPTYARVVKKSSEQFNIKRSLREREREAARP
ncbi:MAG: dihydrolipoyl dehydrogenase family protein [Endomicrobiales bacterium]